jgi:hypothetical protein
LHLFEGGKTDLKGVQRPASKRSPMFVRKQRGAKRGSKAKRTKGRKPTRPHLPHGLEQRHLDLIGLLLIAAGVYLAFVLFFGWEGGKVGYGIETGLEYLVGSVGARIATVLVLVAGACAAPSSAAAASPRPRSCTARNAVRKRPRRTSTPAPAPPT